MVVHELQGCMSEWSHVPVECMYTINPDNQTGFKVYCDMEDGLIQRRFDGSASAVNFERNWAECESRFGNKTGEYWLGLSYVHSSTEYQCITGSESGHGRF